MPSFFSKLAQAASDAGNVVARTAANAHEVLTDRELRKCAPGPLFFCLPCPLADARTLNAPDAHSHISGMALAGRRWCEHGNALEQHAIHGQCQRHAYCFPCATCNACQLEPAACLSQGMEGYVCAQYADLLVVRAMRPGWCVR